MGYAFEPSLEPEHSQCMEMVAYRYVGYSLTMKQQSYAYTIVLAPALGLIKCSFFIQYYQLFYPLRWIRISIWIGAIISTIFYVALSITALILASPWPGESFIEGLLSQHFFMDIQFAIPLGVIGMLVDWYLFILPIPAVWTLMMSTSKKLGVISIFLTGGL